MKTSEKINPSKPIKRAKESKPLQNKDDIDSRQSQEQTVKGDDITHNKKEKKSANKK